jgi:hypothetical protein
MTDLARLSATERQQMIDGFVDATFAGTDPDAPGAGIAGAMRTLPAVLPDDPSTEQVAAWVELAELVGDPTFRDRVRTMAVAGARPGARGPRIDMTAVEEHVAPALAHGVDPGSAEGQRVLTQIVDPGPDRATLADELATFTDIRVERYWRLLGVLNGWAPVPSAVPKVEWVIAALRAG